MALLRSLPGRPAHPFIEDEYEDQLETVWDSTASPFEVPPAPEGYVLRQFHSGDEAAYDDLFHLAWEGEGRFPGILRQALDQGFFVVEHVATGDLVASCIAHRHSASTRHPDSGQLGWLVTDPSHTRKGLAGIVVKSVMNRLMAEGYQQVFLGTEDFRLVAIDMYLKLGWRPFLYTDEMESRWRSIYARLGRQFQP